MKNLIALLLLVGCQTMPEQRIIVPAPALREIFRGGQVQGLENNYGQFMGRPGAFDLVEHTCSSIPHFDNYGRYIGTSVHCN